MSAQFPLFSQVVLVQALTKYDLQRGSVGTLVEYYPMANPEEDSYSQFIPNNLLRKAYALDYLDLPPVLAYLNFLAKELAQSIGYQGIYKN